MRLLDGYGVGTTVQEIEAELGRLQTLLDRMKPLLQDDKDALTDGSVGRDLQLLQALASEGGRDIGLKTIYRAFQGLQQGLAGWSQARSNAAQRQADARELALRAAAEAERVQAAEAAEADRIRDLLARHPAV